MSIYRVQNLFEIKQMLVRLGNISGEARAGVSILGLRSMLRVSLHPGLPWLDPYGIEELV
jgi:hypothetical protein